MNKLKLMVFKQKILKLLKVMNKFLFDTTIDNPKQKIVKYLCFLALMIGVNFVVGKNITHASYAWYTNVSIFLLVNLNIIILLLIFIMIFRNIAKIIADNNSKTFGSRLKTKLVIFSIIISVIPSLFIFSFATTIINISINKWFNTQIDHSLSSSIKFMQDYQGFIIDDLNLNLLLFSELAEKGKFDNLTLISEYIDKDIFSGATILKINRDDNKDSVILSINDNISDSNDIFINYILDDYQDQILLDEVTTGFNQYYEGTIYWSSSRVLDNIIIAYKTIPSRIEDDIESINALKSIYSESRYFSYPVKNSYIMLLVILFLIVIFSAVWGSLLFAKSITKPIEELADASVLISDGNLDVRVKPHGGNELVYLINTFNNMTERLKAHTNELNTKNSILSETYMQILKDKMYIDAIFRNVSSMILLMSDKLEILEENEKASIFIKNNKLQFDRGILPEIEIFSASVEKQLIKNIHLILDNNSAIYLLNMSKILSSDEEQLLIVLDDVTDIVNSQRVTVWKEVATRIAHEVKNPLTPIKLMAERVNKKADAVKDEEIKTIIISSMKTICNEVDSLLELVEEFALFSKESELTKRPVNLNKLVLDVLQLYERSYSHIKFNLQSTLEIDLNVDKLKIKRVLQNLITNAIFAIDDRTEGTINVSLDRDDKFVILTIDDNGIGISEKDISNIFNPYFSKRKGGTGLGLAIVKKIIEEHDGYIEAELLDTGTRFIVKLKI